MPALISNKKARMDYELLETLEAGIELFGLEVKSLRAGQGSLDGAHVTVRGGEAYIVNMRVAPYQPANTPPDYDPERPRRLLLTKKEIARVAGFERQNGLTVVPISMYNKNNKLKMEIAIARGKKKHDKRETIKKRDAKREIERTLKNI